MNEINIDLTVHATNKFLCYDLSHTGMEVTNARRSRSNL